MRTPAAVLCSLEVEEAGCSLTEPRLRFRREGWGPQVGDWLCLTLSSLESAFSAPPWSWASTRHDTPHVGTGPVLTLPETPPDTRGSMAGPQPCPAGYQALVRALVRELPVTVALEVCRHSPGLSPLSRPHTRGLSHSHRSELPSQVLAVPGAVRPFPSLVPVPPLSSVQPRPAQSAHTQEGPRGPAVSWPPRSHVMSCSWLCVMPSGTRTGQSSTKAPRHYL